MRLDESRDVNIKVFRQPVVKFLNPLENRILVVEMQLAMISLH